MRTVGSLVLVALIEQGSSASPSKALHERCEVLALSCDAFPEAANVVKRQRLLADERRSGNAGNRSDLLRQVNACFRNGLFECSEAATKRNLTAIAKREAVRFAGVPELGHDSSPVGCLETTAFLVGGQVREFKQQRVRAALKRHLFDAIDPTGQCSAKIFFLRTALGSGDFGKNATVEYTWSAAAPWRWVQTASTASGVLTSEVSQLPDRIGEWHVADWVKGPSEDGAERFDGLQPKLISIAAGALPPRHRSFHVNRHCFPYLRYSEPLIKALWSTLLRLHELLADYEERLGGRVDKIIYSRPDLLMCQDLDYYPRGLFMKQAWLWSGGWSKGPDWFWIMARHMATDAFRILEIVDGRTGCKTGQHCCNHKVHNVLFSWFVPMYWHDRSGFRLEKLDLHAEGYAALARDGCP
eukprot:TRINITY_DN116878_c0_g1_i1.p1 TRINITY_DN116878_c0_g1~~TRINITY_DN116878_c0_g1_i1.p1  ORF type:complete len:423 (-),score=64.22 TRINITY_DN116878_c0_g1_i1:563-1801(-)